MSKPGLKSALIPRFPAQRLPNCGIEADLRPEISSAKYKRAAHLHKTSKGSPARIDQSAGVELSADGEADEVATPERGTHNGAARWRSRNEGFPNGVEGMD